MSDNRVVTKKVRPIPVEKTVEEKVEKNTEIEESTNEEISSEETSAVPSVEEKVDEDTCKLYGVVNCERLNIRTEPRVAIGNIACTVSRNTELMIDKNNSIDEWYHVFTSTGLEGYCMSSYVSVQN